MKMPIALGHLLHAAHGISTWLTGESSPFISSAGVVPQGLGVLNSPSKGYWYRDLLHYNIVN